MQHLNSSGADRSSAPGSLRRVFCRYLRKRDELDPWLAWLLRLANGWEYIRGILGDACPDPVSAGLRSRVIDRASPRVLQLAYRRMIREELIRHLRKQRGIHTTSVRTDNRSDHCYGKTTIGTVKSI